ncbi:hypothetical protein AX14_002262 [Amanita brunnescens Koide BX004]|nr:hypothetical protein AX14_002262 [Amanita brunnescens Koide BX004]
MSGTSLLSILALPQYQRAMTVDQLRNDLLLVSGNVRDLASAISALGDTVSVSETASLLIRVPTIRYNIDKCEQDTKDISNVSDSDADNILRVIKGIIPDIAKISEVGIQKKDAFAQLPNAFSIEGLFVVPSSVGGTLIRLIGAQLEGVHARVTIIANILIQLAPPNYTAEAKSLKAQVDFHFQRGISAYSS